jgi:Domain of unknown function (DUF4476)
MKTLLTFLISSLFVVPVLAQYVQTQYRQTVTITFKDNGNSDNNNNGYGNNGNKNYEVVVDGRTYSSSNTDNNNNGRWRNTNTANTYGNAMTLQLQTGQHSLVVYGNRNNNRSGNSNTNNTMPLYSSTFILRQGYDANIAIRSNGRVQITEAQSGYNNNNGTGNRDRRDGDDRDRNGNNNNNGGYNNNNGTGNRDRTDRDGDGDGDDRDKGKNNNGGYKNNKRGYNNGGNNNNRVNTGYGNNGYNRTAMADYQFSQLLQTVRGKWFQSTKVAAEKNAFNTTGNYFTTSQIRQLLQLINTESKRLELAELAYHSVADAGNFTQLYDLFSQGSRNELDRYIRGSRY